jgi:hypothetical protein
VTVTRPLADIDPRLISEAFRRARERRSSIEIDSDALLSAIIAEAKRGARDLYSLVKAAERASLGEAA